MNKNLKERSDRDYINIGIIGLGYIGSGVFKLIESQKEYIAKKTGRCINIKRVVDKEIDKRAQNFKLPFKDQIIFSDNPDDIINDPQIDVVVELVGGIEPACTYLMNSLKKGKYVVTANKDLIANKGENLFAAASENNVDILFEASVGGGIPIIGPMKSSLAANNISKIVGIVNGTTNYILTRMQKENLSFEKALSIAQELGYAEKVNPAADIEGNDAACKLAILSSIAFNSRVVFDEVYREGIKKITLEDIRYANDLGYVIKLLAIGSEEDDNSICVRVHPALIPRDHILASINFANNAVYLYGNFVGEVMSYGQGAGDRPTASSVVGDIIQIARNFNRENKKPVFGCTCFTNKPVKPVDEMENKFYSLMEVKDRPGVLAKIAAVFGKNNVSIESMIQKQAKESAVARLVFIIHRVLNRDMFKSIDEISKLDVVNQVLNVIRVEDLQWKD
ncbi:MAG: homoserine dehydrogenase [Actinobacteria bacterium]|nr:homoserine dehydrogenase [Actinomycetota bacterium]